MSHVGKIVHFENTGLSDQDIKWLTKTEKIDGSQLSFINRTQTGLEINTKKTNLVPHGKVDKLFDTAVDYIKSIEDKIPTDLYFYCEYLKTPRHNAIKYSRTPKNNLVLFAAFTEQGALLERVALESAAETMEIDIIPKVHDMESYTESYLGGTVEGFVVNDVSGKPLYKIVKEEFAEVKKELKERKSRMKGAKTDKWAEFKKRFCSENRFMKAFQHLRDDGKLSHGMSDLPLLFKEVQKDILEEEEHTIMEYLRLTYVKDLLKDATKGLAKWYDDLLKNEDKKDEKD